ncbi:MAG: hypothetical protein AAF985_13440, partial [Bacteroidota bacterium]
MNSKALHTQKLTNWTHWSLGISRYLIVILIFLNLSPSTAQDVAQTKRIQLLFVGDIMGHGPQIKSAERVKNE